MAKPRNYQDEYKNYHGKPEQIKNRALRNAARAKAVEQGLVRKGDKTRDVHHVKSLINGGGNTRDNTRVVSVKTNRGYVRNAKNKPLR
jgi:hypothetical protein